MGFTQPRSGSLQIWPRKRARKFLPSANWKAISSKSSDKGLLGFIAYKVGMSSCLVQDKTPDSMTKDKKIIVPVSVLEAPSMKIFSVRLYKNNQVIGDIVLSNDKELKRVIKISKNVKKIEDLDKKDFDDLRLIVYSLVFRTGMKKTPDIAEVGLGGSKEDKIVFVKEHAGKEISISEIFKKQALVDVRGLSKGKGIEGPVKRFGIGLKGHKSEKGRRRPGSLGPWHPHVVSFRVSQAGQLGMHTRVVFNQKIIEMGKIQDKNINPAGGWHKFGNIKTDYIMIRGSIPGPAGRQMMVTKALRKTKGSEKKNFEYIELR
jgi:large subunit ribosomal protein L3